MYRSGPTAGATGVDEIGISSASQRVEQSRGLTALLDELDVRRQSAAQAGEKRRTGRIVAAITVAYSNHEGSRARRTQRSILSSSRKWVAQEMHGS
jgi:hypothetical protein